MAEIVNGPVKVRVPDHIEIPAEAGNLSPKEMQRVVKARPGVGAVCHSVAETVDRLGDVSTGDVTTEDLRIKGKMADDIDGVIRALDAVLHHLKQANTLLDADAWLALRKVNDLIKAQAKHRPELLVEFRFLGDYMSTGGGRSDESDESDES